VKAVRFVDPSGNVRIGVQSDNDRSIRDAGAAGPAGFVPTPEAWEALRAASGPEYSSDEVRLLHPVVPKKIVAIGLNYRDHAAESDLAIPPVPVVFAKFPSALIGHGEEIVVPVEETRPDYEAEVAVVIGRRVYRADRRVARLAVGGISAFNDVSGRRAQHETPLRQFTLGKSFDSFAPMGPGILNSDRLDLGAIRLRATVSGEVMQDSTTANLIFPIEDLIMYASQGMTLEPGDVIATGTPGGVGDSRQPPRYLREGDVVEVWVEGVGALSNPVVFERSRVDALRGSETRQYV
jgi:2-keto-4-pentenoate hydratase/2-oxohepta-3-ene-1,7-dioic acid hydratase in catechol pathway